MARTNKTAQILIRVTPAERNAIQRAAAKYPGPLRYEQWGETHGSVAAYLLDLHRKDQNRVNGVPNRS